MHRFWTRICWTLIALSLVLALTAPAVIASPPETKSEPVVDTLHGVAITDPYRWLEDQKSPATRQWLEGEMAYTESFYCHVMYQASDKDA